MTMLRRLMLASGVAMFTAAYPTLAQQGEPPAPAQDHSGHHGGADQQTGQQPTGGGMMGSGQEGMGQGMMGGGGCPMMRGMKGSGQQGMMRQGMMGPGQLAGAAAKRKQAHRRHRIPELIPAQVTL